MELLITDQASPPHGEGDGHLLADLSCLSQQLKPPHLSGATECRVGPNVLVVQTGCEMSIEPVGIVV